MGEFMRWAVEQVAVVHDLLLRLAHRYERNLTDKDLHLLVMGVAGMVLFFLTFALFRAIEKRFKHSAMIVAFIVTFTNLVVVTFAIEIGQRITGTGNMEFLDIVYGLWGFLFMFAGFVLVFWVVQLTRRSLRRHEQRPAGT